jgi:PelA/Pel-15E family pectate lyase
MKIYWFVLCCVITNTLFCEKIITVSQDGKCDFNTIQAAINSVAPDNKKEKVTIKIKVGIYKEQLFIDKDNLNIIGERKPKKNLAWKNYGMDRSGVIITYPIARDIFRCDHTDDWGAAVVNVRANDILLQNLIVVNDYGFTNLINTMIKCDGNNKEIRYDSHQFALRCMPPTQRFRALSCNFHSRGGDTVSPWDVEHGTFYFKDCTMEGGVDFYCPRGWAYAEQCYFICHNLNAAIWHDGTGNEAAKSVIKQSSFVGDKGYKLGRYHRPAQIYLIDCKFSKDMADSDIYQVNKDTTVEWGKRIFYFNSKKEGGDYNWHKDNITKDLAKKINREWTLKSKWEQPIVEYKALPRTLPDKTIDSIAERMLIAQTKIGGWPKTLDGKTQPIPYESSWTKDFVADIINRKNDNWSTIDNKATTKEILYLSEAFNKTKNEKYRLAAESGIRYLLKMQKPNGGFPQFYPDTSSYRIHITFNDNAMVNALNILYDVSTAKAPFSIVGTDLQSEAGLAVKLGIECILNCQISYKGIKSMWCAQHDSKTLLPAKGRAYEHPSIASSESAGILAFLMSLDQPSNEVKECIRTSMLFIDKLKLKDQIIERINDDYQIKKTNFNPDPSWARFYSLDNLVPIFSGRDGIIKLSIGEIEEERRKGYGWYGTWPKSILKDYPKWVKKNVGPNLSHINNLTDTSYNLTKAHNDVIRDYPNISMPYAVDSKVYSYLKTQYTGHKGLQEIHVVAPNQKANGSAIIILHGGGWRSGSPSMHLDLAYYLARLGYHCYLPSYTLSTNALYPHSILDIVKAQKWIDNYNLENKISISKKVILGFSAGAQLASLIAQNPTIQGKKISNIQYNGLINLDGIMAYIHPISGEGDDVFKPSAGTKWFGYNVLENPSLWLEASPLSHAGDQSPPTLFLNSAVVRMHAGRDEYLEILKKNSKIGEFVTYEAPHSFVFFNPWFEDIVARIHNFINRL